LRFRCVGDTLYGRQGLVEERVRVEKGVERVVRSRLIEVGVVEIVRVRHSVLWWRVVGRLDLVSLRITRGVHQDFVDSCIEGGTRRCMMAGVSVSLGKTKALIL